MFIHRVFFSAIVVASAVSASASTGSVVTDADAIQLVTPFSVAQTTQVPGKTLKAGNYSIRVVDHLSDRVILQIEDAKGASQARFLALESPALRTADRSIGPVSWTNGSNKTNTLRGFAFPGGAAVEFVYPKADAVQIAKVNATKVPAIDPASEGHVSAKNLSKEDLQTITLWTLLATRVGPENASQSAIEAVRYQAPPQRETQQAANVQPLQTQDAVRSPASTGSRAFATRPVRSAPAQNQQIAVSKRMGMTALPHTAGSQTALALFGLFALSLGAFLRYSRLAGV